MEQNDLTDPLEVDDNVIELASKLYEEYCETVGGVAFNGDLLPHWSEFCMRKGSYKQVEGWIAVANLAIDETRPIRI